EILYFTDEIDEFAIKMLATFQEKEFRSVSSGDLGIEEKEQEKDEQTEKENADLFGQMKDILQDKVKAVKASTRLRSHPVCFSTDGDVTIEMEKVLQQMPDGQNIHAEKILEINTDHHVFQALKNIQADEEKLQLYT